MDTRQDQRQRVPMAGGVSAGGQRAPQRVQSQEQTVKSGPLAAPREPTLCLYHRLFRRPGSPSSLPHPDFSSRKRWYGLPADLLVRACLPGYLLCGGHSGTSVISSRGSEGRASEKGHCEA